MTIPSLDEYSSDLIKRGERIFLTCTNWRVGINERRAAGTQWFTPI
ncbi:MAG TPA: hypothetical protein VF585_09890 [Chthoniobacterales bacterium]